MQCIYVFYLTTIISLDSIKWPVFITRVQSVYCAVRAECLNIVQVVLFLFFEGLNAITECMTVSFKN